MPASGGSVPAGGEWGQGCLGPAGPLLGDTRCHGLVCSLVTAETVCQPARGCLGTLSQPPSDHLGCKACWTPCILMQSLGAAVHTEEALCVSCGDHSQHPKGWRRKDGQGSPVPVGSCGVQSGLGCAILPPGTAAVRPLAEVALTSPSCPPPHLPSQGVLKKVKAEVPETVYT